MDIQLRDLEANGAVPVLKSQGLVAWLQGHPSWLGRLTYGDGQGANRRDTLENGIGLVGARGIDQVHCELTADAVDDDIDVG